MSVHWICLCLFQSQHGASVVMDGEMDGVRLHEQSLSQLGRFQSHIMLGCSVLDGTVAVKACYPVQCSICTQCLHKHYDLSLCPSYAFHTAVILNCQKPGGSELKLHQNGP